MSFVTFPAFTIEHFIKTSEFDNNGFAKREIMKKLIPLLGAVVLTGCASISGQPTQPLTVTTLHNNQEITGVSCTLNNDAGSWSIVTPGTATVRKSTGDMTIICRRDALAGDSTIVSKSNTAVWGNILAGGVIGYVVDRNTGAGFDYPATAAVVLRQSAPQLATDTLPSTPKEQ